MRARTERQDPSFCHGIVDVITFNDVDFLQRLNGVRILSLFVLSEKDSSE